jgi:hypothetical protein
VPCYRIREPNFKLYCPAFTIAHVWIQCICVAALLLILGLSYSVLLLNSTRCSAHGFGQPYLTQPSASYSELQKASPTNGCSMVALAHHINLEISTWPSLSSHRSFSQEVSRCLKLVRSLMNPYGKPCVISLRVIWIPSF